jgi:hypothetical protein
MFAGPNGSGKSTFKLVLPAELLGVYINPDEIELEIRETGVLSLEAFGVGASPEEIRQFFDGSVLLRNAGLNPLIPSRTFRGGAVEFGSVPMNSYFAAVAAEFLRHKLLAAGVSFSFVIATTCITSRLRTQ